MPQVVLSFARALGHQPHDVPHWLLDRNVWILLFMMVLSESYLILSLLMR